MEEAACRWPDSPTDHVDEYRVDLQRFVETSVLLRMFC